MSAPEEFCLSRAIQMFALLLLLLWIDYLTVSSASAADRVGRVTPWRLLSKLLVKHASRRTGKTSFTFAPRPIIIDVTSGSRVHNDGSAQSMAVRRFESPYNHDNADVYSQSHQYTLHLPRNTSLEPIIF